MIHRVPPGTRDVLPEEMRELRAISERLRSVFEQAGYGEVWTPTLEYEEVLRRGDERAAGAGFRTFDEHGNILALRSDPTIPIARLVASRLAAAPPPIRLCYFAHAYRLAPRGSGHAREFLQAGLELVGAPAPDGDAEVIGLVVDALAAAGLRRHRVGLGDGSLYRTLLDELEVPAEDRRELLERLAVHDLVGLEVRADALSIPREGRRLLSSLPTLRGGPEILERATGPAARAAENLKAIIQAVADRGAADRLICDLGLVRDPSYYTGAVLEIYDPAVGFPLGGGGRYDELLGRFGSPRAACGLALDVQRVHVAQLEEERLA